MVRMVFPAPERRPCRLLHKWVREDDRVHVVRPGVRRLIVRSRCSRCESVKVTG